MINRLDNPQNLPVAVIVGATSKWQADGPNTQLVHGGTLDEPEDLEDARWGLGGALAFKFSSQGYFVAATSRDSSRGVPLIEELRARGGSGMSVSLDVSSPESVTEAFANIRMRAGECQLLIYNAGYMAGRDLPEEKELLEHFPNDLFEIAIDVACRGPFLVSKEVIPDMRKNGSGSLFFTNNQFSLRGHRRRTGESLYYPRVMMRALSQALVDEYTHHGIHVATVIVDGFIDSPGTRRYMESNDQADKLLSPTAIADSYSYLHSQDRSAWTHELQLTSPNGVLSF